MSQGLPRTNIHFVPVLHGRLEFALEVARAFRRVKPAAVAVELPPTIRDAALRAVRRLPFLSVVHYEDDDGAFVYLLMEVTDPVVEACRLALTNNVPLYFIDRDTSGYPRHREPYPDPYAVSKVGLESYVAAYVESSKGLRPGREDGLREATMAYHLKELSQKHETVLAVVGLSHFSRVAELLEGPLALPIGRVKREGVGLANLDPDSAREVLSEMGYLAAAFENARRETDPALDRLLLHERLIEESVARYTKETKEDVNPVRLSVMRRFARNYAVIGGGLVPDFYQLIIAARGSVDDDFAYELWELGSNYPFQEEEPTLPSLRITPDDLYLGHRRIRFHRRLRKSRKRLVPIPVKKRRTEKRPGEWKEMWQGEMICSYPPEDVVVEGWGSYAKKKAMAILAEENTRVLPFTVSLLDGIDPKETVRNWHTGTIYVKEHLPVSGEVGSLVLVFDPDDGEEEKFPWRLTWLGEHEQESDMAFYSTNPGESLVGPGISRCVHGGFMLTYPPRRVFDIWRDPFFNLAKTKPERLLFAAIDYCRGNRVVYVAPKPPRQFIKSFAERYGIKVVYMPIGQFSPGFLKKLRVFHVLDGYHVRSYARDYIQ